MNLVGLLAALTFVAVASAERDRYDYGRRTADRKHYEPYEYHGADFNKYDVNNDGVDDRLDLDRNGKIDKFENKNKYGYGGFKHARGKLDYKHEKPVRKYEKYGGKPMKYVKHDKYDKHDHHYDGKYDYHPKKDSSYEKDHYATSLSYKKPSSYKPEPYEKKYSPVKKSSYGKSYHDRKGDGYGSYSGVSYGKKAKKYGGYDDYKHDNNKHGGYYKDNKHRGYDYYDKKYGKDYDHYGRKDNVGYRKHEHYPAHRGYQPSNDYDVDGRRYEKYDVTDYELHPDGRHSKTKTKVYKATSYRKDDKYNKYGDRYDKDYKYNRKYPHDGYHGYGSRDRKHEPRDRKYYKERDNYGYKGY